MSNDGPAASGSAGNLASGASGGGPPVGLNLSHAQAGLPPATGHGTQFKPPNTSAFVDLLDPFKKAPLKQNKKKSQGSSRYRLNTDLEFQPLPQLKGALRFINFF